MSLPQFISDASANRFKKTYFNGFVDVSGGDIIVRGNNVIVRENQQNDASNNHYITKYWAVNNTTGTNILPLDNTFTGALNTFTGNVVINGNTTVGGNLILNRNSLFINSAVITLPTTATTLVGTDTTNTLTLKTLTNCDANTQTAGNNSTKIATTSFVRNGTCKKVEVAPLERPIGIGFHPLMMALPNYASTNNESIVRIISNNALAYDSENDILTGLIQYSKDITGDFTYPASAGTIPYKISTITTGFSAVGISGEFLCSQGSSRPIWKAVSGGSGVDILPLNNTFTGALNTFTGSVVVNGNSTVGGNLILNRNSLYVNSAVITLPSTATTLVGTDTTNTLTLKTLTNCDANTQTAGNNSTKIATTSFVRNGTCKKVEVAPLERPIGIGFHPLMMALPNYASTNNESIVRIISNNALAYDSENDILTGLIQYSKDITGDYTYTPSAGTIPYKISLTTTGFSAVGVSGEFLCSQGSSRPIWKAVSGGSGVDILPLNNTFTGSNTFSGSVFINGSFNVSSAVLTLPTTTTTLVGTNTTNTLTNKTLTSPVISSIVNTGTLTLPTSTDTLVGRATTDTLTNKTLTSPVISSIVNTGTLTLPTTTTTLVGTNTTDTLTNKTLTSPVISSIVNTGTLTLPTTADTLVGRATTDTLTNKTLTSPVISSIVNTGTLTLPISTDTLVGRATTDELTNKNLTNCDASTQSAGNDSNRIANTSFVKTAFLNDRANLLGNDQTFTGDITVNELTSNTTILNPRYLINVSGTGGSGGNTPQQFQIGEKITATTSTSTFGTSGNTFNVITYNLGIGNWLVNWSYTFNCSVAGSYTEFLVGIADGATGNPQVSVVRENYSTALGVPAVSPCMSYTGSTTLYGITTAQNIYLRALMTFSTGTYTTNTTISKIEFIRIA